MNLLDGIVVAVALAWSVLCGWIGYSYCEADVQKEKLVMARQAIDNYNHLEQRYNAVSDELEKHLLEDQHNVQTVTQYVDRIVDRPVYTSNCLDDDGLRAANAALLGRALAPHGTDGKVSATDPAH